MDEKEKVRILETTLARLLQWISAAESRISVVLGIDTALVGAIAALAPTPANWNLVSAIAASISITCIITSLICIGIATYPRTSGPKDSFIFFNCIADLDEIQYHRGICALTTLEYIEDLTRQCYRNAQIAKDKFTWVKKAKWWLFASISPWAISIYFLYLAK